MSLPRKAKLFESGKTVIFLSNPVFAQTCYLRNPNTCGSGFILNHRLVEVGRDLWRSSGPTSCSSSHLEWVAPECVWAAFGYQHEWRIHNLSGQPL